jgi:hypothetical protein
MFRLDIEKNPSCLTYSRCREFLHAEKFAKYFENIPQVVEILTGQPPVVLGQDQIDDLTSIFLAI